MRKIITLFFLLTSSLFAHVELEYPLGGETFHQGEYITIRWNVNIDHYIENWDIYYSITGSDGPWIPIIENLDKGDTTQFSVHTFLWVIPETVSNDFRIKIIQDNPGTDWDYISPRANIILDSDCCMLRRGNIVQESTGYPTIFDLVGLVDFFFHNGNPPYCHIEANIDASIDQVVDISDLIYLVEYLYGFGPLPDFCP